MLKFWIEKLSSETAYGTGCSAFVQSATVSENTNSAKGVFFENFNRCCLHSGRPLAVPSQAISGCQPWMLLACVACLCVIVRVRLVNVRVSFKARVCLWRIFGDQRLSYTLLPLHSQSATLFGRLCFCCASDDVHGFFGSLSWAVHNFSCVWWDT